MGRPGSTPPLLTRPRGLSPGIAFVRQQRSLTLHGSAVDTGTRWPRLNAPGRKQRGAGLLEVLIALLILSMSLMATARLVADLHLAHDSARQHGEALRMAQHLLETQRGVPPSQGHPPTAASSAASPGGNADAFTVHHHSHPDPAAPSLQWQRIDVAWTDRSGQAQQLSLPSAIGVDTPEASAALAFAPPLSSITHPLGRHIGIPRQALPQGNGRSTWRLPGAPQRTYVFDHRSGEIVSRCDVAGGSPSPVSSPARPDTCEPLRAVLLQGHVRFSDRTPADATRPGDVPLPFGVLLRLTPVGTPEPVCGVEPAAGLASAPLLDHTLAYSCVVPLPSGPQGWSGLLQLVPRGWVIGLAAGQRRVCRYSSAPAQAESGGPTWRGITQPLSEQNYLVVRGELSCPHSPPPPHNDVFADTVPHQP